jgi:hypothetical protein
LRGFAEFADAGGGAAIKWGFDQASGGILGYDFAPRELTDSDWVREDKEV